MGSIVVLADMLEDRTLGMVLHKVLGMVLGSTVLEGMVVGMVRTLVCYSSLSSLLTTKLLQRMQTTMMHMRLIFS